jgi:hypothetical protein
MNRAIRTGIILLAAALAARMAVPAPQTDTFDRLKKLCPAAVLGWAPVGPGDLYDPESVFSYIDGAGEVYRAYNFRFLLSLGYEKAGAPGIVVDLFDMGSSADAFGVNTMDLEGEDPGIGQGGTYKDGLLSFWRGPYFVSVMAEAETAESRTACLEIGRRIAAAIGTDGPRPALLAALPPGLAPPSTVRYLHSHVILNRHYFVHAENVLNLGPDVEAVLARLGGPGRGAALLIVRYPSEGAASEAWDRFRAAFPPGEAAAGADLPAGKRGEVRLAPNAFAAILGADSDETVRRILDRIVVQVKQGGIR